MIFSVKSPNIKKRTQYGLLLTWFFVVWTGTAQEINNTQIVEEAIRHQNLGLAYLEE